MMFKNEIYYLGEIVLLYAYILSQAILRLVANVNKNNIFFDKNIFLQVWYPLLLH